MTTYSKIYCIGTNDTDADCQVKLQIFVGDDPHRRFDVSYLDRSLTQLGAVRSVLPATRDDARSLFDACLAFYPQHFRDCPTLRRVEKQLRHVSELDFRAKDMPLTDWKKLRNEAREAFLNLRIFEAPLREISAAVVLTDAAFSFRSAVRVATTWLRGPHCPAPTPVSSGRVFLPAAPVSPDPHSRRNA